MLNLRYAKAGRAKNAKSVESMPFPMYGVFCLTTISYVHDFDFKVHVFEFFQHQLNVDVYRSQARLSQTFSLLVRG